LALAALAALAACGGSSSPSVPDFPRVIPLGSGEVSPQIVNSALAVGGNRFSLGLLDKTSEPILGAQVHLRFFDLNGDQPVLKSEADPRFVSTQLSFVDESSGNQKRIVGENGVYVATVAFDRAGRWGLEASVTQDGKALKPVLFQFDVLEKAPGLAVGDPAPPSRQPTTKDVADVTDIDSSYPPRPQMHDITVADALATGKPVVLAFATPAFCESRTCGPVMDTVMDPLYQKYRDQAIFIHIEPYQLKELRAGIDRIPVPATEEWQLQTEPWVFVIDRHGNVAAKFEGIMALDEVDAALTKVLAQS